MSEQAHDEHVLLTQEVRELLRLICETDITELQIERGDAKIHVKRGAPPVVPPQPTAVPVMPSPVAQPLTSPTTAPVGSADSAQQQPTGHTISSPMVGTFYTAPSPKDPPYVKQDDEIHPGDVIGIVEAMKIMNEIESEVHGRVTKILVQNGQPVEYGQPLMVIEPLS